VLHAGTLLEVPNGELDHRVVAVEGVDVDRGAGQVTWPKV